MCINVVFVLFTLLLFEVNEGLLCIETSFPCQWPPLRWQKNKKRKRQEKNMFFFLQSFLFGEPSQILIGPGRGLSKRPSSYCLISLLKRCVSVLYTNCFLKVKEDLLGCCIKGEGGFILIRIWKRIGGGVER